MSNQCYIFIYYKKIYTYLKNDYSHNSINNFKNIVPTYGKIVCNMLYKQLYKL